MCKTYYTTDDVQDNAQVKIVSILSVLSQFQLMHVD